VIAAKKKNRLPISTTRTFLVANPRVCKAGALPPTAFASSRRGSAEEYDEAKIGVVVVEHEVEDEAPGEE
jgi:hypothetical protein